METEYSGLVFCPVCCSVLDVVAVDGELVTLDCVTCGQEFSFRVSVVRFHEHSIS